MDVKYIGRSTRRIIRDVDMLAQGIEGFTTTTWTKLPPGNVQSVIDPAGEWLTTSPLTSMEFVKVEPPAEPATLSVKSKTTASTSSTDKASA